MEAAENHLLRHGSAGERIIGSPTIGSRFETSLLSVHVFPEQPYEVNFTSDEDVVTIAFGLCTGSKAYDSDRRSPLHEVPGAAYFHPAGSEIYVLAERSAELLCFSVPTWVRETILSDVHSATARAITRTIEDIDSRYTAALAPVIRDFIARDATHCSLEGEHLALTFFESLLQQVAPSAGLRTAPGMDVVRLRRVLEYIEHHLDRNLSLVELAGVAALQVNHFARAFRQATRHPPHRYILMRRLARAREMLRGSEESIAFIAYALGLSSQAHFTGVFARYMGITPGRYRLEQTWRQRHIFAREGPRSAQHDREPACRIGKASRPAAG